MGTGRLEAFSDGVIAIIITIMVLELKVPHGAELDALRPLIPVGISYVLSFVFIGIYWNSHHHMLHVAGKVNGRILWANLHLLFWLSLVPFVTGWMGKGIASLVVYATAIPLSFVNPWIAYGLYILVAIIWFIPDRRIERVLAE